MQNPIRQLIANGELIAKKLGYDFPSYNQCVGTDKLFGEYYANIISQYFQLNYLSEELNDLSINVRTYVVIDDFLKDNDINCKELNLVKGQIEDSCLDSYKNLCDDYKSIWEYVKNRSENSFKRFQNLKPIYSIFSKNYFVMIPLLIDAIKYNQELKQKFSSFKKFNKIYLFILQIIDDFEDFEKDYNLSSNHNYFNCKLNLIDFNRLSKYKILLLKDIIVYSLQKLSELKKMTSIIIRLFQGIYVTEKNG